MIMDKVTPTHTKDWYIKWLASIILIFGMILSSNNIYPENIIAQATGAFGWLVVGLLWHDRAIIIINAIAFAILFSSIVHYYMRSG